MKTIKIEITGTSPLLMHRLDTDALLNQNKEVRKKETPDEMAEKSAYFSEDGKELVIPSVNIFSSMLRSASFHKVSGRSVKGILAGTIKIEPFEISLGTRKYDVDVRAVNNRGNKIVIGRAKLSKWKANFNIIFNEELVAPDVIKKVLEDAGIRVGLMSFSPRCSGPFGCFKITKWGVEK